MRLVLENVSSHRQTAWCMVPLPKDVVMDRGEYLAGGWRAYVDGKTAYVLATLDGHERREVELVPNPEDFAPEFSMSDWVGDELHNLLPQFLARTPDGTVHRSARVAMNQLDANPVRLLWQQLEVIAAVPLTFCTWWELWHQQDAVPFECTVTYGTAAPGQAREVELQGVSMLLGEWPTIDNRRSLGLHTPMWRLRGEDVLWEQELVTPHRFVRGQRFEVTGSLLCLPRYDRFGQVPGERRDNLIARVEGPICGVAIGWRSRLLSFGTVPDARGEAWAETEQQRRRANFLARMGTEGDALQERPYGRPPDSGRTGEQADFGASSLAHLRLDSIPEPWALFDLRYSAQAWLLAPTGNREVWGVHVTKARHPATVTYNLQPDPRFGKADLLGWPDQLTWLSGWGTPDSQHRSDNLLVGLYQLTHSPSLRQAIEDQLELQQMELDRGLPSFASGCGSPRGWGRPLMALCHAYAAGFQQAEPMVRRMVAYMHQAASYRGVPEGSPVRVLSDREGKYGWFQEDGTTPVRCWLGWQESIAIMGLWAAWLQLRIPEARELILAVAPTLARFSFYWTTDGTLHHAYGVAYDPLRPGQAPPASAFTPLLPNHQVYTTGSCARWTLAALLILLELDQTSDAAQRAAKIVEDYGMPKNWADAAWWAVRPEPGL